MRDDNLARGLGEADFFGVAKAPEQEETKVKQPEKTFQGDEMRSIFGPPGGAPEPRRTMNGMPVVKVEATPTPAPTPVPPASVPASVPASEADQSVKLAEESLGDNSDYAKCRLAGLGQAESKLAAIRAISEETTIEIVIDTMRAEANWMAALDNHPSAPFPVADRPLLASIPFAFLRDTFNQPAPVAVPVQEDGSDYKAETLRMVSNGNLSKTKAARMLKVSRGTLYRWLSERATEKERE